MAMAKQLSNEIKILLVEDASVMRKMESKVLSSLGYNNIIEAEDGDKAISLLQGGQSVDLIISDWNMPNKNGFELLKWVRESQSFKELPFLMATGRGEKKEVAQAAEAGVSAFISKPFNADELKAKMEEAFGQKRALTAEEEAGWVPQYNAETGKVVLRIAHIQITDHLVLGVLKHLIKTGELVPKHFELETICMSGWNPVAQALEQGTVDGAFVLAPLAMDLYNYGVPLKMIMLAHKNGSICVRNKAGEYKEPYQNYFKGKSFYIPHNMSIHHVLSHMFFNSIGLKPGVQGDKDVDVSFEVVAPIKMPEFLAQNQDTCGYMVAEPLGTKGIAQGIAEQQFLSSDIWENHPCCVVAMNSGIIAKHDEAMFEFSKMMVHAGKFIETKPGAAAEIAVNFLDPDKNLGLKVPLLKNVLTEPKGIKTGDLFPVKDDFDRIQNYMHKNMNIGSIINLNEFIDLRYAEKVCDPTSKLRKSTLYNSTERGVEILTRGARLDQEQKQKALLNKEGKYLMFTLGTQSFGIDILRIVEISKMLPVRPVPHSAAFIMGVINFRGKVIPVVDPKVMFSMQNEEKTNSAYIIILELDTAIGSLIVGVAVDQVTEIAQIKANEIEDAPNFISGKATNYILAMAKIKEVVRLLVDLEKLFDSQMATAIAGLVKQG